MIIHKCDRCGEEIIPRKKTIGELVNSLFEKEMPDFRISDYSQPMTTYLDLCEDCQKSFNKWFTNIQEAEHDTN